MTESQQPTSNSFGGGWTAEKLNILEGYLDAYTTALKNQPFSLMYIDAFAGTGKISVRGNDPDARAFIEGSASRAISIHDKPFDRLIFVESNRRRFNQLSKLREENLFRQIRTENADANYFLRSLQVDWSNWRGVLFLDPFATEVEWSTIERIASFNALDTWILFPLSAVARLMPTSKNPDDISEQWAIRLNRIFGDESWRELYHERSQLSLFGDKASEREQGIAGISRIYKQKLKALFGDRFLDETKELSNSRNTPLFEFIFCVGSPSTRAIAAAKRIARHIIESSG